MIPNGVAPRFDSAAAPGAAPAARRLELASAPGASLREWAVICWDRPGAFSARAARRHGQRGFARLLGDRLTGFGHILSNDGAREIATTYFARFESRAEIDDFIAEDPLARDQVYGRIEVHRWANEIFRRQVDYPRRGQLAYLVIGTAAMDAHTIFRKHRKVHESYLRAYAGQIVLHGSLRSGEGEEETGIATVIEVPSELALGDFWKNEPFTVYGGYRRDARFHRWAFGD